MKTLCIVRHAKSSWKEEAYTDEQRPLNHRGKVSAPAIGKVLAIKGYEPDLILSSTAVRASSTAALIAVELGYHPDRISTDERIYLASESELLQVISECSPELQNVMIVGHNPGLYMLAIQLSGFMEDNLPTCAAVCIEFDVSRWDELPERPGSIKFYEYPRKHGV